MNPSSFVEDPYFSDNLMEKKQDKEIEFYDCEKMFKKDSSAIFSAEISTGNNLHQYESSQKDQVKKAIFEPDSHFCHGSKANPAKSVKEENGESAPTGDFFGGKHESRINLNPRKDIDEEMKSSLRNVKSPQILSPHQENPQQNLTETPSLPIVSRNPHPHTNPPDNPKSSSPRDGEGNQREESKEEWRKKLRFMSALGLKLKDATITSSSNHPASLSASTCWAIMNGIHTAGRPGEGGGSGGGRQARGKGNATSRQMKGKKRRAESVDYHHLNCGGGGYGGGLWGEEEMKGELARVSSGYYEGGNLHGKLNQNMSCGKMKRRKSEKKNGGRKSLSCSYFEGNLSSKNPSKMMLMMMMNEKGGDSSEVSAHKILSLNKRLSASGPIKGESSDHEDICAICHRAGELLCCETCELVYHIECLLPPLDSIPDGVWLCPVCTRKDAFFSLNHVTLSFHLYRRAILGEMERMRGQKMFFESKIHGLQNDLKTLTLKRDFLQQSVQSFKNLKSSSLQSFHGLKSLLDDIFALLPAKNS